MCVSPVLDSNVTDCSRQQTVLLISFQPGKAEPKLPSTSHELPVSWEDEFNQPESSSSTVKLDL